MPDAAFSKFRVRRRWLLSVRHPLLQSEEIIPARARPSWLSEADPIVDIWINRMLGYFFIFLPDKTAKLYESYSSN